MVIHIFINTKCVHIVHNDVMTCKKANSPALSDLSHLKRETQIARFYHASSLLAEGGTDIQFASGVSPLYFAVCIMVEIHYT